MSVSKENEFIRDDSYYKRGINPLAHYVNDCANYLHIQTNRPIEDCKKFIMQSLAPGGVFEFKDPSVKYLQRLDNGDRVEKTSTMNRYIKESIQNKEIIAATFTTYTSEEEHPSLLAKFIDTNVKARSVAKKQMFAAEAAGDMVLYSIKKTEQTNKKLANNSISGAHVSPGNPLYNKTAHSTLTSNCRSTAGFGNANNEKLISGNRHYFAYDLVLNNIISIITHTNYELLQSVIEKYNLNIPTIEQTLECIKYSTQLYWRSESHQVRISSLVHKLKPLQRAAFVYTGDLFHIRKLNESFTREFIKRLSSKVYSADGDHLNIIKSAQETYVNLAHQICDREVKGIGKDYKKLSKESVETLAATIKNIENTINDYRDFIEAFFVTDNVPSSMAYFPESIRRTVLTGDTDSTIFTVQDWVKWYKGEITFDEESIAISAVMVFFASSTISHILSIMSVNLGVSRERLHQIEMKNEFRFDVFVPTQLGKHYFATIGCQEGNVFEKRKMEIKGVYLKSSNAPKIINDKASDMMKEIMQTVIDNKKISVIKYLKAVADIERDIISSVKKGQLTYFRSTTIKDPGSYTKEKEHSPYQHHIFWQTVFAPKYGFVSEPPYSTMKISISCDSVPSIRQWIKNIEDKVVADALDNFTRTYNKATMTTLQIPLEIIKSKGLPKEIELVLDTRRMLNDITIIYYLLLECIGIYMSDNKVKRFASDFY